MAAKLGQRNPYGGIIADIAQVRDILLSHSPYLIPIVAQSEILLVENIETAAVTKGKNAILVNPDFWRKLGFTTDKSSILLHEYLHRALMHPERGEGRNQLLWNIATDAYVNKIIEAMLGEDVFAVKNGVTIKKLHKIIQKVYPHTRIENLYGMTEEELYRLLVKVYSTGSKQGKSKKGKEEKKKQPGEQDEETEAPEELEKIGREKWDNEIHEGSFGVDAEEAEREAVGRLEPLVEGGEATGAPEDINEVAENTKKYVESAVAESIVKRAGTQPGYAAEVLKSLRPRGKIGWRTLLSEILKREGGRTVVQTWKKPSRRYEGMPGAKKIGARNLKILFLVDASGSISERELRGFIEESLNAIKDARLDPSNAYVVAWDVKVNNVVKMSEVVAGGKIKVSGRGGTVIDDALKHAIEEKPDVVVVFTDGYISIGDETARLASTLRKNVKKAIFVTTGESPPEFSSWINIKYNV